MSIEKKDQLSSKLIIALTIQKHKLSLTKLQIAVIKVTLIKLILVITQTVITKIKDFSSECLFYYFIYI